MGLGRNPPKEEGGGDRLQINPNFAAAQLFLNFKLLIFGLFPIKNPRLMGGGFDFKWSMRPNKA